MRFFEKQENITAFISDQSMDFQTEDFNAPLTDEQRGYLKKEIGLDVPRVFWRRQVHGDNVLVAEDVSCAACSCPDADAFITVQRRLPIAIRTADCVPVFLFDPSKPAIGMVHAGWKGTMKGIVHKTILRMKEIFGSDPQDVRAVLGPAIQPCCYEVGREFRQYFPDEIIERAGKTYADVTKNNYQQLLKAGLKKEHINNTEICTHCDVNYFSFRRDGQKAGRMISLMVML